MFQVKRLAFILSRRAERVVPLDLLWFMLFPLAVLRAARQLRSAPRDLPARRLPAGPADRSPSAADRFRFSLSMYLRQPVVSWMDRLDEPRWQRRITLVGMERLHEALLGPVVIATVHTRGTLVMSLWLGTQAIPMAGVTSEPDVLNDPLMHMRAEVMTGGRPSAAFRPGAGRGMARFLEPGRALMVTPDVERGRVVTGTWRGGQMRVATGAFRLARMSGATVVPMIGMETGRWRWRFVAGEPIPAELIAERRYAEAASWFAEQILPEAVRRPRQAHISLVDMVQPASASSRTGSGSGTPEAPATH